MTARNVRSGLSEGGSTVDSMDELTDLERRTLAFEARRWNHRGAKDEAVLKEFGLTSWRYAQIVRDLAGRPAAYVAEPMLVKRLRRLTRPRG